MAWQKTRLILLLLYCLGFSSQILGCGNATPNNGQGLALLHSIWSLLCKKELSNNCMKKCHTWSEWKKSAYGHTIHCSPHMGGHYFSQKNRGMIFSCCDGEFLRPSQNRTAIPSRLWFLDHFKAELIDYLDYYNNRRIKIRLKGLAFAQHRYQTLQVA